MARLHADENIPMRVVIGLRARGHDLSTARDLGRANQRIDDDRVLAFAASQNRVLLTINRQDFIRLHKRYPDHAGIIICTHDQDPNALVDRIDQLLQTMPMLAGTIQRIVRPQR